MRKRIIWMVLSGGHLVEPRSEIDPQSRYTVNVNDSDAGWGFETEAQAMTALETWFQTHGKYNNDDWVPVGTYHA